ncbi:MAG: succinyl-diaminopimelate desuccinylase [Gammaproteobacteria bacterium]|nr:succinyl-diaminopimelate desuccinylase [Gammaproteobacteria bacterium]
MSSTTRDLTIELIKRRSVTPEDAGCLEVIGQRLTALGFTLEMLRFDDVTNLWARRGRQGPVFVFAGHTDVVPSGPAEQWSTPPFEPTVVGDRLYGRGAADMKGSLAAMVTACESFIAAHPEPAGSIAFLLTSDEEGVAVNGTRRVLEFLAERGESFEYCLVGEPSCADTFGDTIRNGRRGSLNARLKVRGVQGHVAYPERVRNPIHLALPALTELTQQTWDRGNDFFPATSFQISNINAGTGAENVVPAQLEVLFNFRFSTESSEQSLRDRVTAILDRHALDYTIDWHLSGAPFLTPAGRLVSETIAAIVEVTGNKPVLSTGGGTSDGRFIATTGAEVIEFGPINATIHKIDEYVGTSELDLLSEVYEKVLQRLLTV